MPWNTRSIMRKSFKEVRNVTRDEDYRPPLYSERVKNHEAASGRRTERTIHVPGNRCCTCLAQTTAFLSTGGDRPASCIARSPANPHPAPMRVATGLLPVSPGPAAADTVKLSGSGICHDANSRWFAKTKNYKAFGTMPECLLNGRAYKGFSGDAALSAVETATAAPSARAVSGVSVPYDRHLYDHWIDEDGDCQNARHELLQELSTAPVKLAKSRCTVTHGRWNDP